MDLFLSSFKDLRGLRERESPMFLPNWKIVLLTKEDKQVQARPSVVMTLTGSPLSSQVSCKFDNILELLESRYCRCQVAQRA